MRLIRTLAATVLALGSLITHAAESGKPGEGSAARFTIGLSLQPSLEITTATDISIHITDRTVDKTYRQDFCVQGTRDAKYTVTAYGETGNNGDFALRGAEGEALPFTVTFLGDPSASRPDPLESMIPSPIYDILGYGKDCDGRTWFLVTFKAEDLQDAGSGLYNGSLTFLVSPV